ncbi:DNA repair protein RecN [Acidithiobacillus ferrivorans]|uniref:DNA repair protein RecN n=1 Tax=Acidithiobacillus ferrivorans TaxID=160808 RepID=A0A060ULG2_9PROT|nr:DNA repair protein RecN [Acidithiobacillus ferrivorans]CDQ09472.1 putative DNA repair protein RecN [Acidithiobacillus ferrivorans]SMH67279.1 DNA repair protein RecN [Acidithiobacillus ferrivorans]
MLLNLQVRDFALIDAISVDFAVGLTVLTGETGAGKSILVDAIALLLGDKGHAEDIRHGAEQAEISAEYGLSPEHPARQWLREQEIADEDICLLRRIIQRNGRSRAFINGRSVTNGQLKEFGETLVELLGQHAHQSLLQPERQLFLLDRFAGVETALSAVADRYRQWRQAAQRCAALQEQQGKQHEQEDWQRFLLTELEAADLQADEWENLRGEEQRLGAVEKLRENILAALARLDGEDTAAGRALAEAQRHVSAARAHDPRLADCDELLTSALIQTEEAITSLRAYATNLEADPERLESIAQRLQLLQDLQRKHHCDIAGLLTKLATLRQELLAREDLDATRSAAEHELAQARAAYLGDCAILSSARQQQQDALAQAVVAQIQQLGMPHAAIELRLDSHPETEKQWRDTGWDQVEIWITANPGHPAQPLAKVASGGELSRIGLALQVILAAPERIDTLIFDEVDVGIGGAVAERVGRLLRRLGARQQVLCVTHLAQVAAQGHQHLRVEKQVMNGQTLSAVRTLNRTERQQEIARMLGGIEISDAVTQAAAALLASTEL